MWVYMLDKQVSLYKTCIYGKKWQFIVFTQFLHITVVHAWQMYQKASEDKIMPLLTIKRKMSVSF